MESPNGDWIEPGVISCDVLVVGAGLAGLTAARELKSRSPDLKVIVLEAKDRVGGRTCTVDLRAANGKTDRWDLGAQWVGNSQKYILRLLRELQIDTYRQYDEGTKWLQAGSTAIRPFDTQKWSLSFLKQYSLLEACDAAKTLWTLEKLVNTVDVDDIFNTPNAKLFDSLSVEERVRQHTSSRLVRDVLEVATKSIYGIPTKRLSFLYFLYYAKCAGSFENLIETEKNGAQAFKVKGGTEQISQRLATVLASDELFLNTAVTVVDTSDPLGVFVHTADTSAINEAEGTTPSNEKTRFKCRRLILAIPPDECGHLCWVPGLPLHKEQLFNGAPSGNLFKCIITYERAFWREKGFSGEIASTGWTEFSGETMPLVSAFDATTADGNPALVAFLHNEWTERSLEERRTALLRDLARFLGEEANDYIDYRDKDWHLEPFGGGCPVACLPPGNMEAFSHIREPMEPWMVHFSGTETATHWPGYMSGAVQSGLRAAHEVLFHLDHSQVEHRHLKGSIYATDYVFPSAPDNSYTQRAEWSPWPRRILLYSAVALGIYLYSRKYTLSHTARAFRPIERSVIKWWSGYHWP
uniref:Amine oxidase n=1 Tax=Steinernema glaseri TaxID=37863 RepID=A0A1I7Y036_9BILA